MDKKVVLKPTSIAYHFLLREVYSGYLYHHVDGLKGFVDSIVEYFNINHIEPLNDFGENLNDKSAKKDMCDEIMALAKLEDDGIFHFEKESIEKIKEEFKNDSGYRKWMIDYEKTMVHFKFDNEAKEDISLAIYLKRKDYDKYDTTNTKDDDMVC